MQKTGYPSSGAFPAMVDTVPHRLGRIYPADVALRSGTLFPELDKPLKNVHVQGKCSFDAKQALSFAAWEVRLYLNTHPNDESALALFRDLCQQAGQPSYACAFAENCRSGWRWMDDPWPWEAAANEGRD